MEYITKIWEYLNTPLAITVIGGIVAFLLSKLWTAKPAWQKYEGTIIAAVKAAEKAIPDTAENKATKRLDEALKYVLKIYESQNGKATEETKQELKEGIQIVHNKLENEKTI
jgi:uncharacterized protein YyaL (SSP411 family)